MTLANNQRINTHLRSLGDGFEVVPPNPDMLTIVRLFLEKIDVLTDEERKTLHSAIALMIHPIIFNIPNLDK